MMNPLTYRTPRNPHSKISEISYLGKLGTKCENVTKIYTAASALDIQTHFFIFVVKSKYYSFDCSNDQNISLSKRNNMFTPLFRNNTKSNPVNAHFEDLIMPTSKWYWGKRAVKKLNLKHLNAILKGNCNICTMIKVITGDFKLSGPCIWSSYIDIGRSL